MPKLPKDLSELHQIMREKNIDAYYALRLAQQSQQSQLFALFTIFFEAYEACTNSTEPMLGKIKIAWWRERIEELYAKSQTRPHPAILALKNNDFSEYTELLNILNEFEKILDGWQPKTYAEISVFISKTFGQLFAICGKICKSDYSDYAEKTGVSYGNLYLLCKLQANKNLFLQDEKTVENAIENFQKNLDINLVKKDSSAFAIIIEHHKNHGNSKRWALLLKLFLKAKKPL